MPNGTKRDINSIMEALEQGTRALSGLSGSDLERERYNQARKIRSAGKSNIYIPILGVVGVIFLVIFLSSRSSDNTPSDNISSDNNHYTSQPVAIQNQASIYQCIVYNNRSEYNETHIRKNPGLSSESLGLYIDGTPIYIIDQDSIYADGYNWIKVQITSSDTQGWIVVEKIKC